jgi:hypothetical protein
MDWWSIVKFAWALAALLAAAAMLAVATRARGVLSWSRSLQDEIDRLDDEADETAAGRRKANAVVTARCRRYLDALSPEITDLKAVGAYVQSIAACFHPEVEHPELQVTVGALIDSLQKSLHRFDTILKRPGFRRLRTIDIGTIRSTYKWYLRLAHSPLFGRLLRIYAGFSRIAWLRYLMIADPIRWIVFFSNRLSLLLLVRYLMVDLHLYIGRLCIDAFERPATVVGPSDADARDLEQTLVELEKTPETGSLPTDPEIRAIRDRLVGVAAVLTTNPTFGAWKSAVGDAARLVAGRHFPDSADPVAEAAVGPLLERGRMWAATLGRGEEYLLARRLYQMRLDTLQRARALSDLVLPGMIRSFLNKAYTSYGWFKWPLKVYRWARRRSPWWMAVEIGWLAAKKAILAHLYGKAFDRACHELDAVYRDSVRLKHPRRIPTGAHRWTSKT